MTRYRMPSCAPTLRARPPNCSDQVQRDSEAPGKLRTTVPNPDTILAGQSGSPDLQVLLKPGNPRPLIHWIHALVTSACFTRSRLDRALCHIQDPS